jgi:allantoate deiminase
MEVNIDRMKKDMEISNSFNTTPGKGVTRLTFTPEYMGAYNYIVDELKKIGAEVTICRAGCIKGRLNGSDPSKPSVMSGSHIDTVLNGGQFDGQVGSVSALEAGRVIVENNRVHSHPIDIVIFPEEEGVRFSVGMAASSAWTGISNLDSLYRSKDKDGMTYQEAMEMAGIIVEDVLPLEQGKVKAMLEVHIEQSVVLDQEGLSVGIIEAIAGARVYDAVIEGKADHAGGTPMSYRNDALQGAVRVIAAVEDIAANGIGPNTVATCGCISVKPGAMNVIPGRVEMTFDLRDSEAENLETLPMKIRMFAENICKERDLKLSMSERFGVPPTRMPEYLVDLIRKCSDYRGIKSKTMMSGALHDSCKLAEVTDIGMIFVPSKEGRSHCPEEWTDFKHIKNASDILLDTILELAE